jgi:hypothetical protein
LDIQKRADKNIIQAIKYLKHNKSIEQTLEQIDQAIKLENG